MIKSNHVTLVDCTLRDGGYYNDWDYSYVLIENYLNSMVRSGVDVVEMGFRTLVSNKYLGPTAYTTDRFLNELEIPTPITVAVMLNAKEVVSATDPRFAIRNVFSPKSSSRVDLVRFAVLPDEVALLAPPIAQLKEYGYDIALNLMQISDRSTKEIVEFGAQCESMDVDIAYFADSFGGLRPIDIKPIVSSLAESFQGPIGCHLHDNMSYALASTLAAVDAGATWVDSTILGMGRGPGNVRTEYLAIELGRLGLTKIDVNPLVNLVSRDFTILRRQHDWGTSLYYFLSAKYGIHPSYVMELTEDGRYSPNEIVAILENLHEHGVRQFDRRRLDETISGRTFTSNGTFDPSSWCKAKNVLIIGPGDEIRKKKTELESFIKHNRPIVLGLGAHSAIDPHLFDAVAVCHPERLMLDAKSIEMLSCPVFAPAKLLDELEINVKSLRDVGIAVQSSTFGFAPTGVIIPRFLSAAYALALAAAGEARKIFVAGFDGYMTDDDRFSEMNEVFRCFIQFESAPPIVSITRTRYNIERSSMFDPMLND